MDFLTVETDVFLAPLSPLPFDALLVPPIGQAQLETRKPGAPGSAVYMGQPPRHRAVQI